MPAYQDSSGRWRYRFSIRDARYSGSAPKGSNTKRAAEHLERIHAERVASRTFVGKVPTVKEFAVRFLEHQAANTKPATLKANRSSMGYIVPALGHVRLDELTLEQVDAFANDLAARLSANTINLYLGHLRHLLELAREWGIPAAAPKFRTRKAAKKHPRFLSEDEADALLAALKPSWRHMALIALRTGLRAGELRGLQWGDVDLARRVLVVRCTDPGARLLEATSPKSGADRTVPLSPDAIAAFLALRGDTTPPADAKVWAGKLARVGRGRSESGGWHAITTAAARAGLKGVGWHTLRHTYASWLVMRGVPLRVVQQYMGHASIKMTERYAHLAPDFGHASIALLDARLSSQWAANALPALPDFPATADGSETSKSSATSPPARLKGKPSV